MGLRGIGGIVFKGSDKSLQKCYEDKQKAKQSDQAYFIHLPKIFCPYFVYIIMHAKGSLHGFGYGQFPSLKIKSCSMTRQKKKPQHTT